MKTRCHYPDLRERSDYITKVIKVEEENFAKHHRRRHGDLLRACWQQHKAKGETVFSGADAFKLYDTYGFPIDLTMEMVADEGMTVDQEAFASSSCRSRRFAPVRPGRRWAIWPGQASTWGWTATPTTFVGYDRRTNCDGKVLAIVRGRRGLPAPSAGGEEGIVVLDQTPFYAEMGGQIADTGRDHSWATAVFVVYRRPEGQGRQVPASTAR